jgi:hypothetical protein
MSSRNYRDLSALADTASTSRVLNLALVAERHGNEEEHRARPLFRSRQLNTALIIKHRLRENERTRLNATRLNATKVVLPFDLSNLRLGGKSFFVGEASQVAMLREGAGVREDELTHDLQVLALIDQLPSLDPFLLREQLRRNGIEAARTYFNILPGDLARMQAFVAGEIGQLVSLAFATGSDDESAARLADALLSTHLDERLEPLRLTLRLEGDQFREGVFCWKGFLYFKWIRDGLTGDIVRVVKEIGTLRIVGPRDRASMAHIQATQGKIRDGLRVELAAAKRTIDDYDRMFGGLINNSQTSAFREFLLNAPERFVELGERLGTISHIASFWRYRFVDADRLVATIEEVLDILQDFEASLGLKSVP